MSFWKSDTRVAYAQRSIAIPAENGKQFNENAKIVLVVPADVGFFQPSESYLQFRISLAQPQGRAPTRLQLDAVLGGQVLIKNIRVLTGTGILIEEIQDYNVLSNDPAATTPTRAPGTSAASPRAPLSPTRPAGSPTTTCPRATT